MAEIPVRVRVELDRSELERARGQGGLTPASGSPAGRAVGGVGANVAGGAAGGAVGGAVAAAYTDRWRNNLQKAFQAADAGNLGPLGDMMFPAKYAGHAPGSAADSAGSAASAAGRPAGTGGLVEKILRFRRSVLSPIGTKIGMGYPMEILGTMMSLAAKNPGAAVALPAAIILFKAAQFSKESVTKSMQLISAQNNKAFGSMGYAASSITMGQTLRDRGQKMYGLMGSASYNVAAAAAKAAGNKTDDQVWFNWQAANAGAGIAHVFGTEWRNIKKDVAATTAVLQDIAPYVTFVRPRLQFHDKPAEIRKAVVQGLKFEEKQMREMGIPVKPDAEWTAVSKWMNGRPELFGNMASMPANAGPRSGGTVVMDGYTLPPTDEQRKAKMEELMFPTKEQLAARAKELLEEQKKALDEILMLQKLNSGLQ